MFPLMILFFMPVKPEAAAPLTVTVLLNVVDPVTVPPVSGRALVSEVRV
jgi:hypothetical protein